MSQSREKFFFILSGFFISFKGAYADDAVYVLPAISTSTEAPYDYVQSPQLGNQVVISSSQIARSGANNIGQLINNVAGVQYVSGLAVQPQILIHAEPAMILVDGQPLTNFSMTNPDINLVPLSDIQKIVITPGVAGTIYGNQSLGGVINIITKPTTTAEQSLTVMLGSPWASQIVGMFAGPMNPNLSYRANAQNEFNSGYRDNSQSDTGNAGLALQQNYKTGSVAFDVNLMRQLQDYPGYLTDIQVAENPRQSIASQSQGTYQGNTGLADLTWTQNINPLWQAETNVSYRAQNANFSLFDFFTQTYNTATVNPVVTGQFQILNRPVSTDVGMLFSNENYNISSPSLYANIQGANQQQYSTYGDFNFPFTPQLDLALSGRLVAIETEGQFFNSNTMRHLQNSSNEWIY